MKLIEEARHRYALHPNFQHQVNRVVSIIQQEHGITFDRNDYTLALEAAACALILTDENLARYLPNRTQAL